MTPATPDRDAIAARAFALYVRRGRQPGRALEDWLEAERQLRAESAGRREEPGVARGTLTGQAVPPKAVPAAAQAPAARSALLPVASPPAALVPTSVVPTPVAPAPAAPASKPAGGRKGRRRRG